MHFGGGAGLLPYGYAGKVAVAACVWPDQDSVPTR